MAELGLEPRSDFRVLALQMAFPSVLHYRPIREAGQGSSLKMEKPSFQEVCDLHKIHQTPNRCPALLCSR